MHIRGAIYTQRGLLTAVVKIIKNKEEMLKLLEAIRLPKKLQFYTAKDTRRETTLQHEGMVEQMKQPR